MGQAAGGAPVVHIGCGLLGIGAVIPFLHLQFPKRPIILVQRPTKWWAGLSDEGHCYLKNSGGFGQGYQVWKPDEPSDLLRRVNDWSGDAGQRVLLLAPHLGYLSKLLEAVNSAETVISSSVGGGQEDLARTVRAKPAKWSRVLLFENSRATAWDCAELKARTYQIVVDRICWELKPDDSKQAAGEQTPERECICEANFASFKWETAIAELSAAPTGHNQFGFKGIANFTPIGDRAALEAAVKRKRALVNATHAVLSMVCSRLLAERHMKTAGQYLATLRAFLLKEYPHWDNAVDTYMRMRCIEVVMREAPEGVPEEYYQALFSKYYAQAKSARERFMKTEDLLTRVLSGERFGKAVERYEEHIERPFKQHQMDRQKIENRMPYRRPDRVEISYLKNFLIECFHKAVKGAG